MSNLGAQEKPSQSLANDYPLFYYLVTLLVPLLLIYISNYFFGYKKNQRISELCFSKLKPQLESHFQNIGENGQSKKESCSLYKLYATGKSNCGYILIAVEMIKRKDLLSVVVSKLRNKGDRITIEVPIRTTASLPLILAVVKQTDVQKTKRTYSDLGSFANKVRVKGLSKNLVCLAESQELASRCMTDSIVKRISELSSSVESIHITDQVVIRPEFCLTLRCAFSLDPKATLNVPKMLSVVLEIVDHCSRLEVPYPKKTLIQKSRNAISSKE